MRINELTHLKYSRGLLVHYRYLWFIVSVSSTAIFSEGQCAYSIQRKGNSGPRWSPNDFTMVIVWVIKPICSNHLWVLAWRAETPRWKNILCRGPQVMAYVLVLELPLSIFPDLDLPSLSFGFWTWKWLGLKIRKQWHISSKSCFNLWLRATFLFHTENWQTWVFHWLSSLLTPTADFLSPTPTGSA